MDLFAETIYAYNLASKVRDRARDINIRTLQFDHDE